MKTDNQLKTELFNKIKTFDKKTILSVVEQLIKDLDQDSLYFWLNNL